MSDNKMAVSEQVVAAIMERFYNILTPENTGREQNVCSLSEQGIP